MNKLVKGREKLSRDFKNVQCIKYEDEKVLTKDTDLIKR